MHPVKSIPPRITAQTVRLESRRIGAQKAVTKGGMSTKLTRLFEEARAKGIRFVNERPLVIPDTAIPIRLSFIEKELTVLCPVNKLNKVPSGLPFNVQEDFFITDDFANNHGLITKDRRTICWHTALNRLLTD